MSRSGFSLLLGWLTEGVGGEALGAGEGFAGEKGKRGRAAVMRVVNNHLRFDGMHFDIISSFARSKATQSPRQIQHLSPRMNGKSQRGFSRRSSLKRMEAKPA